MRACARAQALSPHPILCPARVPRPTLKPQLRLRVVVRQSLHQTGVDTPSAGVELAYAAPVEPGPGDWRASVWRNRPCCAFHFLVLWLPRGAKFLPSGARHASLAGRRGLLRDASGYGLQGKCTWPQCAFWANHTWFVWRAGGTEYAASLHYFGRRDTRALLARLIRTLLPARKLVRLRHS